MDGSTMNPLMLVYTQKYHMEWIMYAAYLLTNLYSKILTASLAKCCIFLKSGLYLEAMLVVPDGSTRLEVFALGLVLSFRKHPNLHFAFSHCFIYTWTLAFHS